MKLAKLLLLCMPVFITSSAQTWTLEFSTTDTDPANEKTFQLWLPNHSDSIRGLIVTNEVGNDYDFAVNNTIRTAAESKRLGILRLKGKKYSTFGDETGPNGPADITSGIGSEYSSLEDEFVSCLDSLARLTGHPEIRYASLLSFGHSTSGLFSRNIAWWNPGRSFGVIIYKSGKFTRPQWASGKSLEEVPVMMFPGEFEQGSPSHGGCVYNYGAESMQVQWWGNRDSIIKWNQQDYLGLVTAQPLDPSLGIDTCYTTNTSWAGCGSNHSACNMHAQWAGDEYRGSQAMDLLALFIKKAAEARLQQHIPVDALPELDTIDKRDGMFITTTELRYDIIEADLSNAPKMIYHHDEFPGNPDSSYWFFDHEFALDWIYYMNDAGINNGTGDEYVPMVSTPDFTVDQDTVRITCRTDSAEIYYSTSGDPARDKDGILYTAPVVLSQNATVRARAYKYNDKYNFEWRQSVDSVQVVVDSRGQAHNNPVDDHFSLSPNPCKEQLTLRSDKKISGDIRIIDQAGEVVKRFSVSGKPPMMDLPVGFLDPGFYILDTAIGRKKFVKQ